MWSENHGTLFMPKYVNSFAATWMKLEVIRLGAISKTDKQFLTDLILMCTSLKKLGV